MEASCTETEAGLLHVGPPGEDLGEGLPIRIRAILLKALMSAGALTVGELQELVDYFSEVMSS